LVNVRAGAEPLGDRHGERLACVAFFFAGCQLVSGLSSFEADPRVLSTASGGAAASTGGGGEPGAGGGGGSSCMPIDGSECSTAPLCGCTPDKNCVPTPNIDRLICAPAGAKSLNISCNFLNDCVKGDVCFLGVCMKYCATNDDCKDVAPDSRCANLTGQSKVKVPTCSTECDPMMPEVRCGSGKGCVFSGNLSSIITYCRGAGTGKGPDSCSTVLNCAPGYLCQPKQGLTAPTDCLKICRVNSVSDCGMGEHCQGFKDNILWQGNVYGICAPN
jgi:hypothetical protein